MEKVILTLLKERFHYMPSRRIVFIFVIMNKDNFMHVLI
jgi:hypothetical protein